MEKNYKAITRALFCLIILASIPAALLLVEVVNNVITMTERDRVLTTFTAMLTAQPTLNALLVILSAWCLAFSVGQIHLALKGSQGKGSQNIFVTLMRSARDKRAYVSPESADLLFSEEIKKAFIFGLSSGAIAVVVRCVSDPFLCLFISILAIIAFAVLWLSPLMWKGRGRGTAHYVLPAMIDFAVSYGICWRYGVISLVFYQALGVMLISIARPIARKLSARFSTDSEPRQLPRETYVSLWCDESGSMSGYESSVISAIEHITSSLARSQLTVSIQLGAFSNTSARVIEDWCPVADIRHSLGRFRKDYSPNGRTPINAAVTRAAEQLQDIPSDALPVAIVVTDGNATDGRILTEHTRNTVNSIEEAMGGVFAIAGVGGVDTRYLEYITSSPDRYHVFDHGSFDAAADAILSGIENVATHGRTAQFFTVMR